jgi:hypothetical protein
VLSGPDRFVGCLNLVEQEVVVGYNSEFEISSVLTLCTKPRSSKIRRAEIKECTIYRYDLLVDAQALV